MSATRRSIRTSLARLPRPGRSSLGVGALVVAGLSLTQALSLLLPLGSGTEPGEGSQRNFVNSVAVGSEVALRTGDLVVTQVEGAETLTRPFDYPVVTDDVFLVVRFAWTPPPRAKLHLQGEPH